MGMYNTQYKPTPIDRYLGLTHNGIIRKVNKIEIDFQNYKEATLDLANVMRPSTVVASAKKAKLGKSFIDTLSNKPEIPKRVIKQIMEESKEMLNKINKELYWRTKAINTKVRSELVINEDLENQIIRIGANSVKEAKHALRQELMEAHPDRYIDLQKAPADKISRWYMHKDAAKQKSAKVAE